MKLCQSKKTSALLKRIMSKHIASTTFMKDYGENREF